MALPQRNRTTYLQNGKSHVHDFQGNLIPRNASLERQIFRLNRRDSGRTGFVIHFRKEVICHAESLFARSA